MKIALVLLSLCLLAACQTTSPNDRALYRSDAFSVFPDSVVQGRNKAVVLSPTHIRSDYQSPAAATFSRLISFKFSINEKDNEAPAGQDHRLVLGDAHESPVITFGADPGPVPEPPAGFLPANFEYTFRVDMSPVLKQFEEKGYYEAFDGSRIARADFKGFFIAGGAEPLSWDFVNLANHGLQLKDPDGDGIYTLTLTFNPYNEAEHQDKEWKLSLDISSKPHYESDQPLVDALFNLSLEEALKNIEPDSTFRTGAKWGGVWTRDISYSILLAFAYHEPEVARISLMRKVKRDRIIQDTGSGGAWPVSSDRTTWALAAWEIYKTTGDTAWLRKAYTIIKNSLDDDEKVVRSPQTGMYSGESSFLDWREQTYPKWMSNMDIYASQNLGTNAVHYRAHGILADMADALGEPSEAYRQQADSIKNGINRYLWMADKGYYAQYLYGRYRLMPSPRFEALGEALAVLFDVADAGQAQSIFEKSPVTAFGVSCIYPQIPGIPPYHNNAVWPFVQSYWNLAAAKAGHERALTQGLAAIYRAGGLFLTNYENFVAETGDFKGTEINSDRMLWSMAGNLAMVHRVFMGMQFEPGGIRFEPVVPRAFGGKKRLSNFKYRNAVLDIRVEGFGKKPASIKLDGQPLPDGLFPATLSGAHTIDIRMDDQPFDQKPLNLVKNAFTLPDPQVKQNGDRLEWPAIPNAVAYQVYKNGEAVAKIPDNHFPLSGSDFAEYQVSALDKDGLPSFNSEPVWVTGSSGPQLVELETQLRPAALPYVNFSGKGFVEISNRQNRSLSLDLPVAEAGTYLIDFRYSNGSGPWNTDNKCALRSLYVNEAYAGTVVFPQRGTDEWSDWGYSNSHSLRLKKGSNSLRLTFEPWNVNMNVDVNTAMLDFVRLIRVQ